MDPWVCSSKEDLTSSSILTRHTPTQWHFSPPPRCKTWCWEEKLNWLEVNIFELNITHSLELFRYWGEVSAHCSNIATRKSCLCCVAFGLQLQNKTKEKLLNYTTAEISCNAICFASYHTFLVSVTDIS